MQDGVGPHEAGKSEGGLHFPTGDYRGIPVCVNFPRDRRVDAAIRDRAVHIDSGYRGKGQVEEDFACGGAFAIHEIRLDRARGEMHDTPTGWKNIRIGLDVPMFTFCYLSDDGDEEETFDLLRIGRRGTRKTWCVHAQPGPCENVPRTLPAEH